MVFPEVHSNTSQGGIDKDFIIQWMIGSQFGPIKFVSEAFPQKIMSWKNWRRFESLMLWFENYDIHIKFPIKWAQIDGLAFEMQFEWTW